MNDLKLYPYQEQDVEELIKRPRIILGSVMRAGKMIETFELVKRLDLQNILIICPAPMVPEWKYNIEFRMGVEWLSRFDIYNYEKLRKKDFTSAVHDMHYDLIVMDEAHKVKNRKAQQTEGAFAIAQSSPRFMLATGTPMTGYPDNLWALLHMIDPPSFGSYWKFAERYCVIQQLPKPPYPRIITGSKNKQELKELLARYMLRREKEELLDHDGHPIIVDRAPTRTIPVELTDSQLLKYQSMEEELFTLLDSGELITAPIVLAQRNRLRQLCLEPNLLASDPLDKVSSPSAKTQIILELAEDSDSPLLVATYYEQYARILTRELLKQGFKAVEYSGAPDIVPTRHQTVLDFQAGKYEVLVGTISSIGLGLTLTASHRVVFTDLFWDPTLVDQLISRLEGSGPPRQVYPVEMIDLWAKGTVEDHLHKVMARKHRDFRDIVVSEKQMWQDTVEYMQEVRHAGK